MTERTLKEQHQMSEDSARKLPGEASYLQASASHHPEVQTSKVSISDSSGNDMEDFCPRCMRPIPGTSAAFCPYCRYCINCS